MGIFNKSNPKRKASDFLFKARTLFKEKRYYDAYEQFKLSNEYDPSSSNFPELLDCCAKLGDTQLFIETLRQFKTELKSNDSGCLPTARHIIEYEIKDRSKQSELYTELCSITGYWDELAKYFLYEAKDWNKAKKYLVKLYENEDRGSYSLDIEGLLSDITYTSLRDKDLNTALRFFNELEEKDGYPDQTAEAAAKDQGADVKEVCVKYYEKCYPEGNVKFFKEDIDY